MFISRASVNCPSRGSRLTTRIVSDDSPDGSERLAPFIGCASNNALQCASYSVQTQMVQPTSYVNDGSIDGSDLQFHHGNMVVVSTSMHCGGSRLRDDSKGAVPDFLPYEVLVYILLFVPGDHLMETCRKVCVLWRSIIETDHFWKLKCKKDFWAECCYGCTVWNPCVCPMPLWRMFYNKLFTVNQTRKPLSIDICPRDTCTHKKRDDIQQTVSIFLIGDSGVGKTVLFSRLLGQVDKCFHHKKIRKPLSLTKCVGFHTYSVCNDYSKKTSSESTGHRTKCVVWDTSGRSVYMDQLLDNYDKAHAFAVFFDITSYVTFFNVAMWLNGIRNMASKDVPVLLVGTKLDQRHDRQVEWMEAADFALNHGLSFIECSSRDKVNLTDIARYLSEVAIDYATRIDDMNYN